VTLIFLPPNAKTPLSARGASLSLSISQICTILVAVFSVKVLSCLLRCPVPLSYILHYILRRNTPAYIAVADKKYSRHIIYPSDKILIHLKARFDFLLA